MALLKDYLSKRAKQDEAILDSIESWQTDTDYKEHKDIVRYEGELYKCEQSHTSQPDWTPDIAHSLWTRIDDPGEEWPEWRQPSGSTDYYRLGAKVSHNGKHWISTEEYNVWEPGVYGWDEN